MTTHKDTNEELDKILEKLHEKLLIGWIVNDGEVHAMPSHGNNDGCTDDAKTALLTYIDSVCQSKCIEAKIEAYRHIALSDNGITEPLKSWLAGYIQQLSTKGQKE
jgi:hypothetical protein